MTHSIEDLVELNGRVHRIIALVQEGDYDAAALLLAETNNLEGAQDFVTNPADRDSLDDDVQSAVNEYVFDELLEYVAAHKNLPAQDPDEDHPDLDLYDVFDQIRFLPDLDDSDPSDDSIADGVYRDPLSTGEYAAGNYYTIDSE